MKKTFQELCDLLPADVNWHDPITPQIVQHIVDTLEIKPIEAKDHQIREMVNNLRDVAVHFHAHQSLRDRLARVIMPFFKAEDSNHQISCIIP